MRKYILAVCWLGCSLGGVAQSYSDLVEQAMDYTFKDSLVQAEELFQQALKLEPSNARNALLFSNLGTVQKRMGKYEDAISSYTLALNIIPYSTAMLLNRAALYMEMNLEDKAYMDYCNVIDLLPDDEEARLYRAYIYMGRRQYKEARIDYNMVLSKDFAHKEARMGLVLLDQKEGKYIAAHDGLNRLLEDYPTDITLLQMRANLSYEQGHWEAALLDVEEILHLSPKEKDIYVMKGDIYRQMQRKTEAKKAYEKAIEYGVSRAELQPKLKQCR